MVIVRLFVWVAWVVWVALMPNRVTGETPNRHNADFSGSWELDYQLSDRSREKIKSLYRQAKAQAERAAERAKSAGHYVDPRVFNAQSVVGHGLLTEKIAQATVLTITQEADHIVINRNDDFALICNFSDMGWKESVIGTEGCNWNEDQLAFQIALPNGLNVFHQFSIAADRSRINVATTVRILGITSPFTLNRVYMPFEPGDGLFECTYSIENQTTCTLSGSSE